MEDNVTYSMFTLFGPRRPITLNKYKTVYSVLLSLDFKDPRGPHPEISDMTSMDPCMTINRHKSCPIRGDKYGHDLKHHRVT